MRKDIPYMIIDVVPWMWNENQLFARRQDQARQIIYVVYAYIRMTKLTIWNHYQVTRQRYIGWIVYVRMTAMIYTEFKRESIALHFIKTYPSLDYVDGAHDELQRYNY